MRNDYLNVLRKHKMTASISLQVKNSHTIAMSFQTHAEEKYSPVWFEFIFYKPLPLLNLSFIHPFGTEQNAELIFSCEIFSYFKMWIGKMVEGNE